MTLRVYTIIIAIGAILIYESSQPGGGTVAVAVNFVLLYLSISVSLDVLLTLMIAVRLIMHTRNIRTATGAPARIGGLYKAITTTLVESSALYAVSSLLALVPWIARSGVAEIFLPALAETQVRAFPQLQPSDRLYDLTTDWTGHRFTAYYSTGCQEESIDGKHHRLRK